MRPLGGQSGMGEQGSGQPGHARLLGSRGGRGSGGRRVLREWGRLPLPEGSLGSRTSVQSLRRSGSVPPRGGRRGRAAHRRPAPAPGGDRASPEPGGAHTGTCGPEPAGPAASGGRGVFERGDSLPVRVAPLLGHSVPTLRGCVPTCVQGCPASAPDSLPRRKRTPRTDPDSPACQASGRGVSRPGRCGGTPRPRAAGPVTSLPKRPQLPQARRLPETLAGVRTGRGPLRPSVAQSGGGLAAVSGERGQLSGARPEPRAARFCLPLAHTQESATFRLESARGTSSGPAQHGRARPGGPASPETLPATEPGSGLASRTCRPHRRCRR